MWNTNVTFRPVDKEDNYTGDHAMLESLNSKDLGSA